MEGVTDDVEPIEQDSSVKHIIKFTRQVMVKFMWQFK